jgi:hypothetical protein
MKLLTLTIVMFCALCTSGLAGSDRDTSKEMKQTAVQPQPECWYSDNEWNVSAWGAYAFSGTDNDRTGIETTDDFNIFGTYDRFLSADHAWGGGLDAKYFFHRYFGIGLEGFALAGRSLHAFLDHGSDAAVEEHYNVDHHTVGGALGTVTLRYPIGCSRFAPYVWAGGGGIFGGSNDRPVGHDLANPGFVDRFRNNDDSKGMGQFGGGIEVRVTRHIGIISDFSWNIVDGPHNNFGLVRSGVTFAF